MHGAQCGACLPPTGLSMNRFSKVSWHFAPLGKKYPPPAASEFVTESRPKNRCADKVNGFRERIARMEKCEHAGHCEDHSNLFLYCSLQANYCVEWAARLMRLLISTSGTGSGTWCRQGVQSVQQHICMQIWHWIPAGIKRNQTIARQGSWNLIILMNDGHPTYTPGAIYVQLVLAVCRPKFSIVFFLFLEGGLADSSQLTFSVCL